MRITLCAIDSYPRSYSINGSLLTTVTSHKYLGVHITNDLLWNLHVEYITNNANGMLRFFRRNFIKAPVSLKLLPYKSLVWSKVEYASSVWDPPIKPLITLL